MKWFLLSVAVFVGSMVLFAAIPRSALIWARNVIVQPLEVTNDSRTASGPSSVSAGSTNDGVNPIETRRREPIQADVAGRARVIDGDTIEVGSVRVRLFGLDAPESAQGCLEGSRRWPCGEQATRALSGRIDGRSVACEERDRDRYGRVVAVCRYGGQDVNAWLVREGWAIAYRRYSMAYVGAEADAKAAKRGVWRGKFVPPWDWRRGDRLESASRGDRVKATRDAPRVAVRDGGGCNIKGNISHNSGKRIYHMPGDRDYERTRISTSRGERYFCSEAEARAAGWRRAGR